MLCPHCHAENKYDALTCDFCMKEIPMTKQREEEIKIKKKIEKQNKLRNSIIKLVGTSLGVLAFIIIIVIAWISKSGC